VPVPPTVDELWQLGGRRRRHHARPVAAIARSALMPGESLNRAIADDQVAEPAGGELLPVPVPVPAADPPALGEVALPHFPPERNPVLVYLRRLRPSGRRSQRSGLEKIARAITGGQLAPEDLPWHVLRYEHTAAIRDWLASTNKPGTARSYLAGLRGVLRECWRLEWMTTDAYMRAVDLDPITGSTVPRGRHVERGEVRAIFEHLARDPRPIARRDAAALALLVGAGVRRTELAGLDREDLDVETGRLLIRGKGGKERVAWLAPTALPPLRDWLLIRGDQPGPLLNPIRKGGHLQERRLTPQAVYDLCKKLVRAAAILAATPHDWRRTWTGNLLEVTDLSTAQKLAGHARPDTTAGYDRRPEVTRRRAAALLHVPYVPPRTA
jgi:integrase